MSEERIYTCMGFGSYDESEQEKRDSSTDSDDSEGVSMNRNEEKGEIEFETEGTEELLSVYQSEVEETEE